MSDTEKYLLPNEKKCLEESKMSITFQVANGNVWALEQAIKAGSPLNKAVNNDLKGKYEPEFKKLQKIMKDFMKIWEGIEADYK